MRLAVLKERRANETRVAATPETVKRLVALGLEVAVETGAGQGSSIPDSEFQAAGATIAPSAEAALQNAGIVFAVQTPGEQERARIPRGALLVSISGAMADKSIVKPLADAGIDAAAMELLPRITRAQSMDVLSSQANLAGYRAIIEGANAFHRGFAMMMTAAGTVQPARVFVLGAGVAGLQAIATARRLGAIVSATDVRPAAKEEIKSLGANFVGVEDEETAKQTGAYAREMTPEFRRKQAELVTATIAKNDLIICTALVQGGKAPTLVTKEMVAGMKPGSVVVDLASDGGGNCELTKPGEVVTTENGVTILGYLNWPGRLPVAASTLYAKNLFTFLNSFWDKDAKAPKLPPGDDIVKGVMLTRGGAVVHANFADAPAAAPATPLSAAPATPPPDAATPKPAEPLAVAAEDAPARPPPPAATQPATMAAPETVGAADPADPEATRAGPEAAMPLPDAGADAEAPNTEFAPPTVPAAEGAESATAKATRSKKTKQKADKPAEPPTADETGMKP